ncbi:MAG: hypothetical protein RLN76_01615 [Phycisphaeraceae bacterium]
MRNVRHHHFVDVITFFAFLTVTLIVIPGLFPHGSDVEWFLAMNLAFFAFTWTPRPFDRFTSRFYLGLHFTLLLLLAIGVLFSESSN